MSANETLYTLAFLGVPGIGSRRIHHLRERFGSLEAAWHAPVSAMTPLRGLSQDAIATLDQARRAPGSLERVQRDLEDCSRKGITLLTPGTPGYPPLLREIPDPPAVLFVRGRLPADMPLVALVGTRAATPYGLRTARRLGCELAEHGVGVVSGLAIGIDAAAHAGAVSGGVTVAVLGSGLDHVAPACNRRLAEQIVSEGGALVSEYAPAVPPAAGQYPARNRIVSGMCQATVVIEAPERSGALITGDLALDQGREVMAVPGPIDAPTSAGCHALIAQGAKLVRGVEDILCELPGSWQPSSPRLRPEPMLPVEEARVYAAVGGSPQHADRIAMTAGLSAAVVTGILLVLELKTLVVQLPGNHYVRHP